MKFPNKRRKGFTLIEMTIVLFIISLLILIIIPNISTARKHAENIHQNAMVSVVQSQVDSYLDDHPDENRKDFNDITKLSGDYLTPEQAAKASKEKITVVDGYAKGPNNATNKTTAKS